MFPTTTHSFLFSSRLKSTPDSLRKSPRGSNAIYYYLLDNVSPVTSAADTAAASLPVSPGQKSQTCAGKEESLYRRSLDGRQVNHLVRIRHTLSIINIKMSYDMHR
ncbi:hypothetical protein CDAR_552421 [Caerostris darwini]|uniref:Uncharacterized protein n=1 Tax=Caerostris darwini TaxID=1538125 RepID=A0AAV4NK89_9ARAC|nr:hypothetical protein CDAR_552421 [Caerostris darwini]